MVQRLKIVCSGGRRRPHPERTLGVVEVDGDTLTPVLVAESSTGAINRVQGTPIGQRELAANPDAFADLRPVAEPFRERSPDGLHEKWRFKCRKCQHDVPVSDERMRTWAEGAPRVIDITDLPVT